MARGYHHNCDNRGLKDTVKDLQTQLFRIWPGSLAHSRVHFLKLTFRAGGRGDAGRALEPAILGKLRRWGWRSSRRRRPRVRASWGGCGDNTQGEQGEHSFPNSAVLKVRGGRSGAGSELARSGHLAESAGSFGCHHEGAPLAPGGWKPRTLLNIPQRTG